LENPPKGPVNGILEDGLELANCGGVIVIHTPGHTPGHVSLYHKQSKTLIAADALVVSDGQLLGSIPEYSVNYELAMQSLKKFSEYDIEAVICYHGGLYTDNVNQRIAELAASSI
jgi:glyoxylase-like metal-dependent hydrolase (beta-lactamase superfamily II)